jgi:hypothetical protein
MSDNEARFSRGVYDDREAEAEPRSRRRRPVADWGVGDDVFEHMPRRRFTHTADGPARDRRPPARDPRPEAHEPGLAVPQEEKEREIPRGRVEDGRRTLRIGSEEDVPSEIEAVTADRDLGEDEPTGAPETPSVRPYVEPGSRRTVKIGGRPEGAGFHQGPQRRRPPRPAHERIGSRPDRIAMYAFALGVLLILIAIFTSH